VISFVVCSVDASKLAAFANSLAGAAGAAACELVDVRGAPSLCAGWTEGLERAKGDTVVFCHDDIELFAPDLPARVARHLERFDVVGVAGTDRCVGMDWSEAGIEHAWGAVVHDPGGAPTLCFYGAPAGADAVGGIQAMDGVFLATTRAVARAVGFDAATFDGWHGYDADFSFRAHLAGFRLGVALDLPVVHRSMGRVDEARVRYHRRFADKHAARLASGRGPWVDLRVPIVVPDGIAAAFDRTNLERLHARSRDEARRRHEAAGRPYAAPRNGPCPCGSGLRYRECHGSVDRP